MKTRITLVVVSLFLSLLIGISLSQVGYKNGGPEGPESRGKWLIGLSMDTLKEVRWIKDRDIFVERARELGADVLVQTANSDDTRQVQDVQALISRNVDVLVIIPHNGAVMASAVRLAHKAGIPVIAYDRIITDCDLDLYITFDNVRVGELQAQYLIDRLPPGRKSRIVRIHGAKTDNNAFLFKAGQDRALQPLIESGRIEVIHEDWADNWSPAKAKQITNAAISRHGTEFDAVLVTNDGTAGGAIQALKEEGLAGKVLVTGQDADLAACQRIADGTQSMTIYKPIKNLAVYAAETAVKMAERKPIIARHSVNNNMIDVASILLEVVTVTRENLEETVVADGFHSRESIFRDAK